MQHKYSSFTSFIIISILQMKSLDVGRCVVSTFLIDIYNCQTPSTLHIVIETGEVIYITFADHSKTARSIAHRHTTTRARWTRQYIVYTLPPNTPQAERMTRLMIETHISSSGAHICTLLDRIDTTLLYHWIPNGITPHTYLFPLRRQHVHLSIGIHAHISCECPSYQ